MRSDDPKLLQKFINLPTTPRTVHWATSREPGRDDWSLSALMSFDGPNLTALLQVAKPLDGKPPQISRDDLLNWFPSPVRDRYSKASADKYGFVRVDATPLDPAPFFAVEKSPLLQGDAMVFQGEGLVYLRLFTM
jgi:hypothetical protein